MMKLSKISKVILISGILLAFSCGSFATTAWADKNCEKQCETTYKGDKTQIKSCKAQCRLTDTQAEADAKIGSNGGKVTTYKTNGRTTGIKTSGGFGDVDDSGTITSANGTGAWEQAQINKNTAQSKYTDASTAYNKCVAQKGIAGCTAEKAAMDEARGGLDDASKAYNQAQKDASKAYYENEKAKAKAEKAEAKALKSDQKDLKKAEKAYEKCMKKNGNDASKCETEATAVTTAQKNVDSHSSMVSGDGSTSELDKLKNAVTNAEGDGATDALNNLRIYKDNKEQAAKKAEEECERYSAMTSKDAQSKAKQACAQAVTLRKEADAAASAYSEAGKGVSRSGATAAEGQLKKAGKAGDAGVLDISESRQITVGGSGNDSLGGYRSNYFNYSADGDVLGTVTRRAALAVVSLKPIVYIFAGFGLIAFAWMAIFNKISWKWFANIAMGLFLVANMGRLIEYLVADDGANGGYYIGAWSNGAKAGGGANRLANAFKDSYYVYGDVQYHEKGVRDFQEVVVVGSKSTDLFSASARGFCQGTSGSGFANFTSCMGDILSTVQKTTKTIQTVKATAEDMVARVEAVTDTAKNIAQMANSMVAAAKSGDVTGILANMGNMMGQASNMVSTTTGAVGSLTNAASTFSNNIQDLGKSTDQQAELANRRASGEATNKFDAMLKGQEWNSATGGVEKVDGQYAGKESWVSAANNLADTVKDRTATLAGMGAAATQSVGAITNIVQTTSLKDLTGFGSDTTINDKIAHHQEKKATQANERANAAAQAAYQESNAGKNAAYREQNNATNQLYSNMQAQQSEVKNLQNQKAGAEAAVKQNCADEGSALCQASKAQLSATEAALNDKQTQLAETEKQYSEAKKELDNKYNVALESNIAEAKTSYDDATSEANKECGKDSTSAACATARRKALEAANQYSSYVTEKEKQTNAGRYETKEQVDTKIAENATIQERKRQDDKLKYEEEQAARQLQNEASNAKREYEQAVDNASNLYTQMNAQEQEAKELEQQAKTKAAEAQKACDRNSASSVCTTAQTAAAAAKKAVENKKEQIQQTKSEYAEAKKHAETAYNASVTAGAAQAQRDYDNAVNQQKRAKEIIEAADAQMGKASEQAKSAETDYNAAMKEAQAARKAYQEAQASGNSEDEIKRLKAEYDAKLDAKAAAEKEYQQKSKAYNDLKQQKKDAEKSYNDAYTKAKDAGGKLASYTNESVNKTGESRLDSREDVDNQALVNQYKSDTNPVALAQASKNNYIERQNNAAVAEERLREKQAVAAQAKKAYEDAVQKANASGSEADRRAADRLKNNYNLAENEVETAEQSYKKAVNELSGYEADYRKKAKEAETYKQSVYAAQMKQASEDINKYEAAVNKQLKVVDAAATAYTQAKGSASDNDPQKVQKAAQLYNDYKAAKETYDSYVKSLKQARNSYTDAQKKYQESKTAEKKL